MIGCTVLRGSSGRSPSISRACISGPGRSWALLSNGLRSPASRRGGCGHISRCYPSIRYSFVRLGCSRLRAPSFVSTSAVRLGLRTPIIIGHRGADTGICSQVITRHRGVVGGSAATIGTGNGRARVTVMVWGMRSTRSTSTSSPAACTASTTSASEVARRSVTIAAWREGRG